MSLNQRKKQHPNTDEAFTDAIYSLSSNMKESHDVATEIVELFFQLAKDRDSLPANSDKETIDAFLTALVALMNNSIGKPLAVRSLETLFKFIKNGKSQINLALNK
jgi:hypothetical protein